MTQSAVTSLWKPGGGVQTGEKVPQSRIPRFKSLACYFYRSHTQPHTVEAAFCLTAPFFFFFNELRVGTETAPLNSQRTPDLSRVYLTVSPCSNRSWFPLRWKLLLCGGSQSGVAGSTPYLSLRPNRGGGVFMAQSGLCSQSGAAPDSLRPLLQSPLRYL